MMERQLRQLVHLVNDLLDVSRITTGKMTLKPSGDRWPRSSTARWRPQVAADPARAHSLTSSLPSR
jgi:signal transduction histidine kinase